MTAGEPMYPYAVELVLQDIGDERARQDAKWGEQNHPDGTGDQEHPLVELAYYRSSELFERITAGSLAYRAKDATDRAARKGRVTWTAILLEEVFEALAEDDPSALRTELIQVAAVAASWAEAIDRRAQS